MGLQDNGDTGEKRWLVNMVIEEVRGYISSWKLWEDWERSTES